MQNIGFSLVDDSGNEIQFWGDSDGYTAPLPNVIQLPNGDHVHCPVLGGNYSGYTLVQRMLEIGSPPSIEFDGTKIIVTRAAPPPVDAGTVPPRLIASALSIEVANSDISAIGGAFNLVGAVYLDVGQFMLLFLTPQPDANYFAVVTGSAPKFSIIEQTADYLIVQATVNGGGTAYDPARFSVQIFRMES